MKVLTITGSTLTKKLASMRSFVSREEYVLLENRNPVMWGRLLNSMRDRTEEIIRFWDSVDGLYQEYLLGTKNISDYTSYIKYRGFRSQNVFTERFAEENGLVPPTITTEKIELVFTTPSNKSYTLFWVIGSIILFLVLCAFQGK